MKRLLLAFVVLSINAYAQTEPANYRGVVTKFRQFYNAEQADSIFSMFSPEVRVALPADKNKLMITQLHGQLGNLLQTSFSSMDNGVATYKASFTKSTLAMKVNVNASNKLAGLLFDNYTEPKAGTANSANVSAEPAAGETPFVSKSLFSGDISGTLTMPDNAKGKVPVVLIIAGSGPTDRNGNSPGLGVNTNAYKMLAIALRKSGIASLRYDKRLVGESKSTTKESQLRIDDYVEDASRIVNELHNDARFSKVIVLGHSEGSLVGMLASIDQPVDAFISVSGAGRQAYYILKEQMKSQPDFISTHFNAVLDSLNKGKLQPNVDASLYFIARPSVQPYLMSWIRYDPQRVIKRLKIPILIIQGTTDLQIGTEDAEKLKKAKSEAVLQIIPNMNHVLKEAPADKDKNLATYNNPDLPLKPELVTGVVDFVNKLK